METLGRLFFQVFRRRLIAVFLSASGLFGSANYFSACTSSSGALYSWGDYEGKVYTYLQGESPAAQISALQDGLLKIEETGKKVPPGYYAHLGMLYAETGDDGLAISCFIAEKTRFPEAAVFMDYLLARYGL
jgi:hypothetical protein